MDTPTWFYGRLPNGVSLTIHLILGVWLRSPGDEYFWLEDSSQTDPHLELSITRICAHMDILDRHTLIDT